MNTTTYSKAIHWIGNHFILCNNLPEIDPTIYDNAQFDWYDEDENPTEIYQWYITDCSESDVEWLKEHFPSLLFTYSSELDLFILAVDHFGTGWDYVPCETTLEERFLK